MTDTQTQDNVLPMGEVWALSGDAERNSEAKGNL